MLCVCHWSSFTTDRLPSNRVQCRRNTCSRAVCSSVGYLSYTWRFVSSTVFRLVRWRFFQPTAYCASEAWSRCLSCMVVIPGGFRVSTVPQGTLTHNENRHRFVYPIILLSVRIFPMLNAFVSGHASPLHCIYDYTAQTNPNLVLWTYEINIPVCIRTWQPKDFVQVRYVLVMKMRWNTYRS